MNKKGRKDYMLRFWLLLLLVLLETVGLYYLPDKIDSVQIKKVDMLSDLRINDQNEINIDSLNKSSDNFIANRAKIKDVQPGDSIAEAVAEVVKRDSIYNTVRHSKADSATQPFEDFSSTHQGLGNFFAALKRVKSLNRPVRIAVLGDSFIEGDIFTCDIRKQLQSIYGGGGVGWMPITSEVAGFRRTIKHTFSGWSTHNMLHQKGRYTASGYFFTPKDEGATVQYRLPGDSSQRNTASLISIYYTSSSDVQARLTVNGTSEEVTLPVVNGVGDYRWTGNKAKTARLTMNHPSPGFTLLGMSLEQQHGVTVDNFSLRGNSGIILNQLDQNFSKSLSKLRPYDLVILQYGLNVANAGQSNYSSYVKQMTKAIAHIRNCFPSADILIMGVSDRGVKTAEGFETMKTIYPFIAAQQKLARDNGIVFWNTFLAMGGEGSMARLVQQGKAAKDYTHLGFPGGKIVADAFMRAFHLEKAYYDAI